MQRSTWMCESCPPLRSGEAALRILPRGICASRTAGHGGAF
jgi:hypothetical protein